MSNFIETAKSLNAAKAAYGKAFRAELHSLKPMTDEDFLATCDVLISLVNPKREFKSAVHNLMCACVYQSYGEGADCFDDLSDYNRWELMARFVKRYEMVKATLSKKLWDLPGLSRGDDGYGDLIDSLPLAGRAVMDGIFQDDIANYKQLEAALEGNPLKDFILHGENYVEMTLEKGLEKAFLSVARDLDDEEEDHPRENPHCVVQMVPIKERDWGDTMGMQLNVVGPFRDHHEASKYVKQEEKDAMVVKLYRGVVLK